MKLVTQRGTFEFERELRPEEIASTDFAVCFSANDPEMVHPFFSAAQNDVYPDYIHNRVYVSSNSQLLVLMPAEHNANGRFNTW